MRWLRLPTHASIWVFVVSDAGLAWADIIISCSKQDFLPRLALGCMENVSTLRQFQVSPARMLFKHRTTAVKKARWEALVVSHSASL